MTSLKKYVHQHPNEPHYYKIINDTAYENDCAYGCFICNCNLKNLYFTFYEQLVEVSCSYNNLKSLEGLPQSIQRINCSHNKIISINIRKNLPNLKQLNCSYNRLKNFNNFDNGVLLELECRHNPLEEDITKIIFKLPLSITYLHISLQNGKTSQIRAFYDYEQLEEIRKKKIFELLMCYRGPRITFT